MKTLVGGIPTVFRGDKRITTNVTKPDGTRAFRVQDAKPARRDVFEVAGPTTAQ